MSKLRVIVLGDEQVGKTSIIRTFVSQSFPSEVPPANPPIIIPPELSQSRSFLTIIDFYYRREQENTHNLVQEVLKADGIILVYDVSRPATLQRVCNFWLPLIYENSKAPCILVGNKSDATSMIEHKDTVNEEIREKYPECYISIETSAKSYSSISKLFQITEQVILYPASPLYDSLQGTLTPEFMRVLKLIFRRLDKDRDNRLNVLETQDLNRDTYHQNLNIKEVNALFSMITEVCPYGIDDKGIKFEGFCKLQELLIRKLKTKNCWTLVKYFGFDESLTLENKFRANFTDGRTVEISDNCVQFLVEIFNQFSVDSLLTRDEIIELFSTLTTPPWMAEDAESWDDYAEYVQTTTDKELSLSSWISLWSYLIYKDPSQTLYSLLMIGYPNDVKYAFEYAEIRNFNVESSRKMFKVMLLGNDEDSQSSLMRSFLGKSLKEKMGDIVCGTIDQSNQILESKYLIFLKNPDLSNLEDCDIACIIFDGSLESINYLKESVIPFLPQKVPRLLILNKKDNQDHENVYAFSLELGLREYAQVNFAKRCPDSLFKQIRDIVQYPFKGSMRKETVGGNYNGSSSVALWFLLGVGFASSAVYIGKKLTQSSLLRF